MALCELHSPADARDVDDARRVPLTVLAALREKPEERGGHEEDRGRVDGVYLRPLVERLVLKKRTTEGLCGFVLREGRVVKETRDGSDLACAVSNVSDSFA